MTPIKMVRGPEGALWPIHKDHIILVGKMLSRVSEGDWLGAAELVDKMREDDPDSYERPHVILWSLQRMTDLRLEPVQDVFTSEEWKGMAEEFSHCHTYKDLGKVLVVWSNLATERLGGF